MCVFYNMTFTSGKHVRAIYNHLTPRPEILFRAVNRWPRILKMEDLCKTNLFEPVHEKTNNLGSDQVQHKPACTVTEETQNHENLGISRGGNVLSV